MDLQAALQQRAKVEAFQRRHRVGLLTLLFTDLVGSTKLKQDLGDHVGVSLIQRHHAVVREILGRFKEGEEIGTAGDSFFIVFTKPSEAAQFSLMLQNRLRSEAQQTNRPLLNRIGIHIGEVVVEERPDSGKPKDLYGLQVDICARVMSLAEGDQILLTRSAFDNARQVLKGQEVEGVTELSWLNHGPYLLKGVEEPLEICEVGEIGQAVLKPPPDSEKVHRYVSPDAEPVLGWRPALEQVVPGTKWIIERKLGEGGFGEVWLGRHETLKEKRVFKFCFRADRVRALKREVTLFRVMKEKVGQHPNIVGIQEVFFDEPPFYIVMDYAEAQDVRAWCDAQGGVEKVPLATRLEIVAQVADAVQAAHEAGVIHRDVKPSNILVGSQRSEVRGQDGSVSQRSTPNSQLTVKLTDFGIGQVVSQEALAGMTRMGFTQTMVGPGSSSHTGTQIYMAPELLAGQGASAQSDIYSLGVVLYQLIIGNFARPLTTDWAKKIGNPLLRKDLEKCFAGDPQERFGSARELAVNLRALGKRQSRRTAQRIAQFSVLTLFVAVLLAFGWYGLKSIRRGSSGSESSSQARSIAVRPFLNETSGKSDDYLSDGLSSEIIRRLREIPSLNPLLFTNRDQNLPETLAQASVPYLLDGSIQKSDTKLRIKLRLIKTSGGYEVPLEVIEAKAQDIPGIPGDVVTHVAHGLGLKLSPAEMQKLIRKETEDPLAFDDYLSGSHAFKLVARDKVAAMNRAIEFLEHATNLDSRFAMAYVRLADVYNSKARHSEVRDSEPNLSGKAFNTIETALRLDSQLPDAYALRGTMYWSPLGHVRDKDWDVETDIKDQRKALALNPRMDKAHENLGFVLSHCGLMEEALAEAEEALRINSFNRFAVWIRAGAFMFRGDYQEALNSIKQIPDDYWGGERLGEWARAVIAFNLGKTNDAALILRTAVTGITTPNSTLSSLQAMFYAASGDTNKAEEQIMISQKDAKQAFHYHHAYYQIGAAYALMHNNKEAIRWLKQAAKTGFPCYPYFERDPSLKNLKGEPEFESLKKELKKRMEERRAAWAKG